MTAMEGNIYAKLDQVQNIFNIDTKINRKVWRCAADFEGEKFWKVRKIEFHNNVKW